MPSGLGGGYPKYSGTLWPVWPSTLPTRHRTGSIARLPAKTLEEIFLYACDTYTLENQTPDLWLGRARDVMIAPITLSQVCKRWRNIANTTPRLWRNVVVPLTSRASTYATEMIEECIIKSDPYTINLCFLATPQLPPLTKYFTRDAESNITQYPFQEDGRYTLEEQIALCWPVSTCRGHSTEIINTVIKSTRRWERVLFSGSMANYEELFCRDRPALYLPKLSSLGVPKGCGLGSEGNSIFEYAYALRHLQITETTFMHYTLPWIGLRTLYATSMQDTEILEILARCPRLEELITKDPWTDPKQPPTRHVLLPQLQSLSLTMYGGKITDIPLHLINNLTTPSILEIKLSNFNSETPLQNLRQLLRRSCACDNLQTMCLTSIPIVEQDLIDLLGLTKCLVTLHIDVRPPAIGILFPNNLLMHLSNTRGSSPFLPHLRTFTCFGIQFVIEDLITMLRARLRSNPDSNGLAVQPLRDVYIHVPYSAPLSPALQVAVDSLGECGINLRLSSAGVGNCGCFGR